MPAASRTWGLRCGLCLVNTFCCLGREDSCTEGSDKAGKASWGRCCSRRALAADLEGSACRKARVGERTHPEDGGWPGGLTEGDSPEGPAGVFQISFWPDEYFCLLNNFQLLTNIQASGNTGCRQVARAVLLAAPRWACRPPGRSRF